MIQSFSIVNKHYQTILKQGLDNYPEEVGGFLGGVDGVITGILPLFNQHLYNKTDTFAFTSEDLQRGHDFCRKHGLEYYGLYHTHPKGVSYPSKEDVQSGQTYHFILSLRDQSNPVFNAFYIENKAIIHVPFKVIADAGFSSKELTGSNKQADDVAAIHPAFKGKNSDEELAVLNERIGNMLDRKKNEYEKMPPKTMGNSDFSTLA